MPVELLATSLPELWAAFVQALPVILGLILIEGLLSVDNALAIAAMASHLDEKQRAKAMNIGYIGAYGFRVVALLFASWIINNHWVMLIGALYLVWLMCAHFAGQKDVAEDEGEVVNVHHRTFASTIAMISLMDLSLSVDNVVAAVAMSPKLWVVCVGVFIGILALRFVAGACIKLLERFPILADTAFVLIGYVGGILLYELLSNPASGFQVFPGPVHVTAGQKFIGIVIIITLSILYSKSNAIQKALSPLMKLSLAPMRVVAIVVGLVLKVVVLPFKFLFNAIKPKSAGSNPQIS